jgi:CDP-glucose 4,6-dehydratase
VALASARAGNVIGGGDWSEDRLVPDVIRGIAADEATTIRRPDAIRPWQHVLEPLRGYLMLAQRLFENGQAYAEAWNFGPRDEDAIPAGELAQRLVSLWGKGELKIQPDPAAPHEAQYLRLNCGKALRQLGWQPVLALSQTLAWSVEWYRSYYDNPECAASITVSQIERYVQAAFA